jgi:hypothetical protein
LGGPQESISEPLTLPGHTEDRTINPDLERFMAKRMGAKTIEVKASHLALISRPDAITNLILQASPSDKTAPGRVGHSHERRFCGNARANQCPLLLQKRHYCSARTVVGFCLPFMQRRRGSAI